MSTETCDISEMVQDRT